MLDTHANQSAITAFMYVRARCCNSVYAGCIRLCYVLYQPCSMDARHAVNQSAILVCIKIRDALFHLRVVTLLLRPPH